jgi:hypothetical protein
VATLADGTRERAELLVGADGLGSIVRQVVTDARPRFAGYTAWRGVAAVPVEAGRMSESWGIGELGQGAAQALEDTVVLADPATRAGHVTGETEIRHEYP